MTPAVKEIFDRLHTTIMAHRGWYRTCSERKKKNSDVTQENNGVRGIETQSLHEIRYGVYCVIWRGQVHIGTPGAE